MIVIVGCIIVLAAVLTGFVWGGGHLGALVHPSEIVTIAGAALGALVVMSPRKVLGDLVRGLLQCVKGSAYDRRAYEDLFQSLYEIFRVARHDGIVALESHVTEPHESRIFSKYPRFLKNHHLCGFVCGALTTVVEGTTKPEQMAELLEAEIKVLETEQHAPLGVLSKTADALPGFGIVAAVMGIVITMSAIDGPVEEVGEKVGAALVGTFLGILLSYGFVAPLAVRMEFLGAAEAAYFRTAAAIIQGVANGAAPKVVMEQARRGMSTEVRFTREHLDELLRTAETS
jgi:chemotaxis protein MotA